MLAAQASIAAAADGALLNILWVVSEDNNPWIGAYRDHLAHTHNIDTFAKSGLLYRNLYRTRRSARRRGSGS